MWYTIRMEVRMPSIDFLKWEKKQLELEQELKQREKYLYTPCIFPTCERIVTNPLPDSHLFCARHEES